MGRQVGSCVRGERVHNGGGGGMYLYCVLEYHTDCAVSYHLLRPYPPRKKTEAWVTFWEKKYSIGIGISLRDYYYLGLLRSRLCLAELVWLAGWRVIRVYCPVGNYCAPVLLACSDFAYLP